MLAHACQLPARLRPRLEWLASHHLFLLALLLAANGLTRPYAGLIHDSRLYAAQVTERVAPGSLAGDLFLLHGSQDRYTLFTPLLAPLVRLLGLETAFLVGYLLCKALFFWALLRFVLALVEDRLTALLALFFLAVSIVPFGGNGIFHVNETFFTPRLPATALVLLALEQMLGGRRWLVPVLLAAALLLHPLMAFVGLLVVTLWWLAERLRAWQLAVLIAGGALAATVAVAWEPLGTLLFGHLDPEWRGITLSICFFVQPEAWTPGDWGRTAVSALVVAASAWNFARHRAPLLLAVLLAGAAGLAGSVVAVHSNYLLLLQSSPYRTLWLLELLAIPLGFAAVAHLWQMNRPFDRFLALALLLIVTTDWGGDAFPATVLFLALVPAWALVLRGHPGAVAGGDWLSASSVAAFLLTVALQCACNLADVGIRLSSPPTFYWDNHPVGVLTGVAWSLFKFPLFLLVLAVALWLRPGVRQLGGLLCLWIAYQGMLFGLDEWPPYANRLSAWQPHGQFVADFLHRESARRPAPLTVYWPADLKQLWFVARVNSYYNWRQLSGCAFNRGTAVEGRRRAGLVGPFEMDYYSRCNHPSFWMDAYERFHGLTRNTHPTRENLLQLVEEEKLDFVVLESRFPGLYCATDGCFYVYNCRQVRAAAKQTRPQGAGGLAARSAESILAPETAPARVSP